MTTKKPPLELHVGDRLRLRKIHPCGGWIWKVTGLGADIRLACETCGRRILLPRSTLERRVKTFVERSCAPVPESAASDSSIGEGAHLTAEMLGLQVDDILEATRDLEVTISFFYLTNTDSGSGRLAAGLHVLVTAMPAPDSDMVLVEPVDYAGFEQRFVPGGIRQHETYTGYAIPLPYSDIARFFRPARSESASKNNTV